MIKRLVALGILSALCSPAFAAAPACDAATPITAPNSVSGDTSAADAAGGISSIDGTYTLAGHQKVWTFVAGDNVDGSFTVTSSAGWGLFITTGCDATATGRVQSMATGDPSTTLTLDPTRYTAGTTYYVILSGLQAAVNAGMTADGPFTVGVTPNLPVTLQGFSVD